MLESTLLQWLLIFVKQVFKKNSCTLMFFICNLSLQITSNRVFFEMHKNGNRSNANIGSRVKNVEIEPGLLITSDSKSNTIFYGLTWHVLLRRSLNFCSYTTCFLDFMELRGFSYNQ